MVPGRPRSSRTVQGQVTQEEESESRQRHTPVIRHAWRLREMGAGGGVTVDKPWTAPADCLPRALQRIRVRVIGLGTGWSGPTLQSRNRPHTYAQFVFEPTSPACTYIAKTVDEYDMAERVSYLVLVGVSL